MSGSLRKHEFSENTLYLESEDQEQNDNANLPEETETKTIQNHNVNVVRIPNDGEILEWHRNDAFQGSRCPEDMILDMQAHVHDVHVIDGDKNNEPLRDSDASNVHRRSDAQLDASVIERKDGVTDFPSSNWLDTKPNFNRSSSSIMTAGLPPLGGSSCKSTTSDLRRSSMSAVDNERLKIDTEVEWLREKLRIVQEGREKLNFSMEPLEREKLQLQLLEDITRQLREIRQLTEPRKAVRQTSLPLPFSKGGAELWLICCRHGCNFTRLGYVKEEALSKCVYRSSQKLIRYPEFVSPSGMAIRGSVLVVFQYFEFDPSLLDWLDSNVGFSFTEAS
ncbi:hypothetical protein RHGRI_003816 [Rhododendron griersonianum]|uniref:Uncharacterized protein n=1 Tax=Rhododendron griersonianum TaxID=479676 RepID=A0AAV6L6C3_9ERIC|nr:hypothetical protein RHGRI_003816 [Rhododendron griersonianum]